MIRHLNADIATAILVGLAVIICLVETVLFPLLEWWENRK